jgi:hypothetical protein
MGAGRGPFEVVLGEAALAKAGLTTVRLVVEPDGVDPALAVPRGESGRDDSNSSSACRPWRHVVPRVELARREDD